MIREYEFFAIEKKQGYAIVYLNKPERRNAMDSSFWFGLSDLMDDINADEEIKSIIFAGKGKSFSSGLDLEEFFSKYKHIVQGPLGEGREEFYKLISKMQVGINKVYDSPKPSIAVVQKHCIGGALDLISACDIRYATKDAKVSLREAKVGIVADMGSINRLPAIIGQGYTREMAFTGRDYSGDECRDMGLFNRVFETETDMLAFAEKIAKEISENPSIVIRGVKKVMSYSEGKSLRDGLDFVCVWNSSFMDSQEFRNIIDRFLNR